MFGRPFLRAQNFRLDSRTFADLIRDALSDAHLKANGRPAQKYHNWVENFAH